MSVTVSNSIIGSVYSFEDDRNIPVQKFTWQTTNGLTLSVITLDAAITELTVPDRDWILKDIALGSDTLKDYLAQDERYRCTVQFEGIRWPTMVASRLWDPFLSGNELVLSNWLPEECGTTIVHLRISVGGNNSVRCHYEVYSTTRRNVKLGHRLLINLGGKSSGYVGTYSHVVQINADRFINRKLTGAESQVTRMVAEDVQDFRIAQHLGLTMYQSQADGIDGVYQLDGGGFALRLIHARSGRVMELYCDHPWLKFSTLDDLPDPDRSIAPFYEKYGLKQLSLVFDIEDFISSIVPDADMDEIEPAEDIRTDIRNELCNCGRLLKHSGLMVQPIGSPYCLRKLAHSSKPGQRFQLSMVLKFGLCKTLPGLADGTEADLGSIGGSDASGETVQPYGKAVQILSSHILSEAPQSDDKEGVDSGLQ